MRAQIGKLGSRTYQVWVHSERERVMRSAAEPGRAQEMVGWSRRKHQSGVESEPVVFEQSVFMKKLPSVAVSPANSALLLTAVFVLWIFLHSVPSPFPSPLPPSLSVVGSPPLHRLHPMTFCKHFIREPLVFSKAPRQTDRAAVNRAGGNRGSRSVESFVQNNNVTKLSAALL